MLGKSSTENLLSDQLAHLSAEAEPNPSSSAADAPFGFDATAPAVADQPIVLRRRFVISRVPSYPDLSIPS